MSFSKKIGFVSEQTGSGSKGQRSKTDSDGNRVFSVFTYSGNTPWPVYKEGDEDSGLKLFRGKTPQTVAKKVVTEICQMIKKDNPTYFRKHCQPVSSKEIRVREKELEGIKDTRNVDKYINWDNYPGFRFDLQDTMNSTADGKPRVYKYYGERMKLDNPKKYNQNKFQIEPDVVPIRKNYTLGQALLDHMKKSKKAAERERKNQNLSKSSRKKSRGPSRRRSRKRSRSKSKRKTSSAKKRKKN